VTRPLCVLLGLGALAAAWLGAFQALCPGPFSAHMAMHMTVVAVAAPLLSLGVAGGKLDPALRAPALLSPVPASIAELLLVWGWHTPALHHAARGSALAFVLEQVSFLLSGLWLWLSALGGAAPERPERSGAGVLALLLTSMHMTLLGALMALPPRLLYQHGAHGAHGAPAALSPLSDQHLGGAMMIVLGGITYLAGGLWLAARLLRRPAPTGVERRERGP